MEDCSWQDSGATDEGAGEMTNESAVLCSATRM